MEGEVEREKKETRSRTTQDEPIVHCMVSNLPPDCGLPASQYISRTVTYWMFSDLLIVSGMLPGGLCFLFILHLNRIGKTWLNISVHGESRPQVSLEAVG
jgi:hypothetical protein